MALLWEMRQKLEENMRGNILKNQFSFLYFLNIHAVLVNVAD
ncbi:MAG: hypothetical protein ACQCN6_14875 [Candidatus Bathyarchaeia archaeon]|jgi:hypothetical protein